MHRSATFYSFSTVWGMGWGAETLTIDRIKKKIFMEGMGERGLLCDQNIHLFC